MNLSGAGVASNAPNRDTRSKFSSTCPPTAHSPTLCGQRRIPAVQGLWNLQSRLPSSANSADEVNSREVARNNSAAHRKIFNCGGGNNPSLPRQRTLPLNRIAFGRCGFFMGRCKTVRLTPDLPADQDDRKHPSPRLQGSAPRPVQPFVAGQPVGLPASVSKLKGRMIKSPAALSSHRQRRSNSAVSRLGDRIGRVIRRRSVPTGVSPSDRAADPYCMHHRLGPPHTRPIAGREESAPYKGGHQKPDRPRHQQNRSRLSKVLRIHAVKLAYRMSRKVPFSPTAITPPGTA